MDLLNYLKVLMIAAKKMKGARRGYKGLSSICSAFMLIIIFSDCFVFCQSVISVNVLWMASKRLAFGLFNASTNLGALAYSYEKFTASNDTKMS